MSIVKDLVLILLFVFLVIKYFSLYKILLEERNYFINILSHDLRVAMLAQLRGLNLIKNSPDNELINDIIDSNKFSIDLINMLINTYKYKNKKQIFIYENINIAELLEKIINDLNLEAKNKNIKFICTQKKQNIIIGDKNELYKALFILTSTAINNAFENSNIEIKIKNTHKHIHISISYSGNKLTNNECKTMFFKNPHFSAIGHGIKMHLCKKIIDFHKGIIKVENVNNNNNAFSFLLPLPKDNKTVALPALIATKRQLN